MRLFVAVEVPAEVRAAVDATVAPLRAAAPGLRWVPPERYHLTLVFLGTVSESVVQPVVAAMRAGCEGVTPFALELDGALGTFGRRVLWAGLTPSPELVALAGRVSAALGVVVAVPDADREYRAHLTLARSGREPVRSRMVAGVAVTRVSWPVERVVLMRSAGGYSVLDEAPLRD